MSLALLCAAVGVQWFLGGFKRFESGGGGLSGRTGQLLPQLPLGQCVAMRFRMLLELLADALVGPLKTLAS